MNNSPALATGNSLPAQGFFHSYIKPGLRPLYHFGFRLQLRVHCFLDDLLRRTQNRAHGIPPALIRFRVGESLSVSEFLNVGKGCADRVQDQLRSAGKALSPGMRILDFGCGCGRVLRWLMQRAAFTDFHGVDVDGQAILWCTQNLRPARFEVSHPHPPLPYPAAYFDAIYCISVFTHLDEDMQVSWLSELRRILKPDGVLLFTVHGALAARELNSDEQAQLESAGFLFHRSRKLHGILPSWYHTSWHTEKYIVDRASRFFTHVNYVVIPDSGQDIVRCRT